MLILKNKNGVSLMEVLVTIGILALLILAIFSLTQYVLKITAENKFRLGAIMLADQKMERIKNLPYSQVGTLNGIINGPIPDNEVVNNLSGLFYVNTLIRYIDDPFDGALGGSPDDLLPTDYKEARIRIRWFGQFGQKDVVFYTKITPKGMETSAGGGILSIMVFNASGQPVSQADVHIENNSLMPTVNFDAQTNAAGRLDFPGAPQAIESYEISATKTGYSTSSTSPRTASNPNPTQPHATVLNDQKTEISFAIDLVSNLTIKTINQSLPENWKVNNDNGIENQTNSRLAIDNGGFLYLVWQDYRASSDSKIYAQKYNPNGQIQWNANDVIIGPANNQILPEIKISTSTGDLYIGWNDNSNGNQDGYLVKRSAFDGSDLWNGARKIDTEADAADQTNVRLALFDKEQQTYATVVWQDNRNGNLDIYLQRYDGNKNESFNPEIKINKNSGNSGQSEPAVTIDLSDNIYAAWTDERDGNLNIYAAKYSGSGQALWQSDIKINTDSGTANHYNPAIASDSLGNIYLAWTDERNGNADIYLAKYNDAGQALWSPDNIMVNAYAPAGQSDPSLALDNADNLYISWTDERDGNQDIYAQKINAGGNRLWPDDIRININLGVSNQYNSEIIVSPFNNKAYVSWQDDRSGNYDIYTSLVENYGAITNIANVPLIIKGAKTIGTNPIIFKYDRQFITNSSGQLILSNLEWDSYSINLSPSYSTYHLVMSAPELPLNLAPNTDLELILYLDD
ncbi:hypothetical protein A3H66_01270 [Candidatus Falkowbacteria bacterium RIFCSPLOWO2_02_FULL_45_21]|uniref:Uncharacterized protein n=1 Tax=Candidatus Falkowbacteria bacterium RIFCSPLOWO2_02_FULL_45_21 TaxID=1797989 RepID=A0A1F5SCA1_9BACT|nr:MAG: hypothetical protein A3H66_01270 [Candidatus Falkowbacteria bacterium RIFCSPLOWO2_02_FULL_45_21]